MDIYLDNAATTRPSEAVWNVIVNCREEYGNPSSLHFMGEQAKMTLEKSRREIADLIEAYPNEIYFTSGGTESDNQAIVTGAAWGRTHGKFRIVSQKTEHKAVLNILERLKWMDYEIVLVDVDKNGVVDIGQLENVINEQTALVSIMLANNEVGTIQPVERIADICHARGALFHTDAVQAVGQIPVDVEKLGCDMLSFSAHKFHGLKGAGALYIKHWIKPYPLITGGGQERGARSGTENVLSVKSMCIALEEAVKGIEERNARVIEMRDRLISGLLRIPDTKLNGVHIFGDCTARLPGNVNVSFKGVDGETLVLMLNSKGICVSAGSACSSNELRPSYVLKAMSRSDDMANSAVRFSLSGDNTPGEIDYVIDQVRECVKALRGYSKQ